MNILIDRDEISIVNSDIFFILFAVIGLAILLMILDNLYMIIKERKRKKKR